MIEAKNAVFKFDSFKIPYFILKESNATSSDVKIGFFPSGKYHLTDSKYELKLKVLAHNIDNEDKPIFKLTAIGIFEFNPPKTPLENIPDYFYKNAIAIMFPYIRAFIFTMTAQSNTKTLKLGLMNLSNLEKPLKDNTKAI
jgi:preprotein translocase subunit SecB